MEKNKIWLTERKRGNIIQSVARPGGGLFKTSVRFAMNSGDLGLSGGLKTNYLHLIVLSGLLINNLLLVLRILGSKRITLAEKAIQAELRNCYLYQQQLILALVKSAAKQTYLFDQNDCKKLKQINIKLLQELKAFLAAANHNLNYLEQYYEHDFWLRINHDKFSNQFKQILGRID